VNLAFIIEVALAVKEAFCKFIILLAGESNLYERVRIGLAKGVAPQRDFIFGSLIPPSIPLPYKTSKHNAWKVS
jgi:hypothetical protein